MALELTVHARRVGLTVVRMRCSRIRSSCSKNLVLRDGRGRDWEIRISDHFLPRRHGHAEPHFNLISLDGSTGFELAVDYVSRVSRGEIAWWQPKISPKRRGQR